MKNPEIQLPWVLMQQWGMPLETTQVLVCAGQKKILADIIVCVTEKQGKKLQPMLSEELRKKLYLSQNMEKKLCIKYEVENKQLRIGPFVGLLALSIPSSHMQYARKSFSAELLFLAKLSRNLHGYFFLFRTCDICWKENIVKGYHYLDSGSWESGFYPLPDVIYDRIPSRRIETSEKMRKLKQKISGYKQMKYFNSFYLNKWKVYEHLSQYPEISSYLPETLILNETNMKILLNKYPVLFAKPANGSLGRGIIKIRQMNRGKIFYTLYRRGTVQGHADSAEDFLKKTQKARRGWDYIIQQGLFLKTYQNSHFDIRIIFQKDGKNEWKISKRFFRVARPGSSVSNLSSGGHVEPYKNLASKICRGSREKQKQMNREIKKACTLIAEKLEEKGCFGELGLDLGLDTEGKLWFIEANSKPRKTTETNMSMTIVKNTFLRPLEYAVYLAGFAEG